MSKNNQSSQYLCKSVYIELENENILDILFNNNKRLTDYYLGDLLKPNVSTCVISSNGKKFYKRAEKEKEFTETDDHQTKVLETLVEIAQTKSWCQDNVGLSIFSLKQSDSTVLRVFFGLPDGCVENPKTPIDVNILDLNEAVSVLESMLGKDQGVTWCDCRIEGNDVSYEISDLPFIPLVMLTCDNGDVYFQRPGGEGVRWNSFKKLFDYSNEACGISYTSKGGMICSRCSLSNTVECSLMSFWYSPASTSIGDSTIKEVAAKHQEILNLQCIPIVHSLLRNRDERLTNVFKRDLLKRFVAENDAKYLCQKVLLALDALLENDSLKRYQKRFCFLTVKMPKSNDVLQQGIGVVRGKRNEGGDCFALKDKENIISATAYFGIPSDVPRGWESKRYDSGTAFKGYKNIEFSSCIRGGNATSKKNNKKNNVIKDTVLVAAPLTNFKEADNEPFGRSGSLWGVYSTAKFYEGEELFAELSIGLSRTFYDEREMAGLWKGIYDLIVRIREGVKEEKRKLRDIRNAHIRAAIGAIMSRNGSHNIGSHVLSSLSHHIRTTPEDRDLYHYIQGRMDYIASATTSAPDWSVPIPFVGGLMRTFYSQHHLLEHLAESDGLRAYHYRGAKCEQQKSLRIVVRKKEEDGYKEFFAGAEENKKSVECGSKDVKLSIPGGLIGQHAFYNIIENIIRNAAKHSWVETRGSDKNEDRLEVYIDFESPKIKNNENLVGFTIWNNLSKVSNPFWEKFFESHLIETDKTELFNAFCASLDGEEVKAQEESSCFKLKQFLDDQKTDLPVFYKEVLKYINSSEVDKNDPSYQATLYGGKLPMPLHHRVEMELAKPFIKEEKENNEIRRTTWGLSEMKISAGFLRRASVDVVGGGKRRPGKQALIAPCTFSKPGENDQDQTILDRLKSLCLAYKFWVKSPKSLLVLVNSENDKRKLDQLVGVDCEEYKDVMGDGDSSRGDIGLMSDYEFVLVDTSVPDDKINEQAELKLPFRWMRVVNDDDKSSYSYATIPQSKLNSSNVVQNVYRAWLDYLWDRSDDKKFNILLNVRSSGGREQGLLNDRDLYRIFFQESLLPTIEEMVEDDTLDELQKVAIVLLALYPLEQNPEIFNQVGESVNISNRWMIRKVLGSVAQKVLEWVNNRNTNAAYRDRLEKYNGRLRTRVHEVATCSSQELSYLLKVLKKMSESPSDSSALQMVASFLNIARLTSDILLRKRESQSPTLPLQYHTNKDPTWEDVNFEALGIAVLKNRKKDLCLNASYSRHSLDLELSYSEPLSGSQSYLTDLINLSGSDYQWAMRLMENALLRIIVVDERVSNFVKEHGTNLQNVYKSMQINVVDTQQFDTSTIEGVNFPNLETFVYVTKSDVQTFAEIVIIHQGIIDKWWPGHSDQDETTILESLRKQFETKLKKRLVVVTTGRGRPENIPSSEKVIAFSSIKEALFKRNPEKLTLVNALMNILPGSPERSDDND